VAVGPGFAGITAPACLTATETASVAAPGDTLLAERALAAAEQAAYNIAGALVAVAPAGPGPGGRGDR
jgi:hypothetical protein